MIAERIVPVRDAARANWARELIARKPWRQVRLPAVLRVVLGHPRDAAWTIAVGGAVAAIIANSLFMQPGPHPAPIFAVRPPPVIRDSTGTVAQPPHPRPGVVATVAADAPAKTEPVPLPRPRVQTVAAANRSDPIADLLNPGRQLDAIQRVLNEFGYGPIKVTGTLNAETRGGIERFERDHNLPVTGQNTPRLRQAIMAATGRPLE